MAWDEEYEDDYYLDEEDEMGLMEDGPVEGEFFSDRLQEELDYELYEQEKDEYEGDDFPESFEEWKLQKEQEQESWDEYEHDVLEPELIEYEE
jgi:hypothetical protein